LELVRISKEIQKPLVEKHYGQWLKEMGDGALTKLPAPDGPFYSVLRLYGPEKEALNGEWVNPPMLKR